MHSLCLLLAYDVCCMPYHCLYAPALLEAAATPSQLQPALTWALLLPPTDLPKPTHGLQSCLVQLQLLLLLPEGWPDST